MDSWVDRPNSFRSGKAASAPASAPTFGPLFVNTNFTWEFEGRKLIIEIQLHLQGPYVSMKHLHSLYEVTRCVTIEVRHLPPPRRRSAGVADVSRIVRESVESARESISLPIFGVPKSVGGVV